MTFDQFITFLNKALQANGGIQGMAFDGSVANLTALYKNCDRTDIINDLQQKAQQGCDASDWVPQAHRADFMTVCERDLRLRFRNRIQSLGTRTIGSQYAVPAVKSAQSTMDTIESGS